MRELPPEVGKPLYDAAARAHAERRPVWSCVVTVADFVGAPIKATHRPTSTDRVSTDELLAAVESLGWRLEHVNHVYVQTTTSTNAGFAGVSVAGVSGHIEAHYLFRRAGP
jgi:hypothetical protein